ncbi:MAG: hypothetical protein Q8L04_12855 [Ignavibacteria bacterium]|nr:hypothetical protein [Ignavibacteria bacterium]
MKKYIKYINFLYVIEFLLFSRCSKQKYHLTIDRLYNSTYLSSCGDENSREYITLKSGHFESTKVDSTDGGPYIDRYSMDIYSHNIAFGDLCGDGREYAALCLAEWTGGSGVFISLNVIVNSNGSPIHIAGFQLGDRIKADSVFIQDKVIRVKAVIQRDNQGACCPDSQTTWKFKIEGDNLKKITEAQF